MFVFTNEQLQSFIPSQRATSLYWTEDCEEMVGGPSTVITGKAVVNETSIRDSTNWCKFLVGIDASQLYLFSTRQAMPTGLYTRWELDSESGKPKLHQKMTKSFENMVVSYCQRVRRQCEVESFYRTSTQKQNDAYSLDGFCGRCNTVFEAMGRYYQYCPCQAARFSFTEQEIQRGFRKRELDELRKQYKQEKR